MTQRGYGMSVEALDRIEKDAYQRGLAASDKRVRELEKLLKCFECSCPTGRCALPEINPDNCACRHARLALSHTKEGENA